MIVVTGAGGKTGRAVLAALAARGAAARAFVRRAAGGVSEAIGDMTVAADWSRALSGARAVYHICPNMHPEEVAIGRLAIAAARRAGVGRFVYHSVLHPQAEAMPHHGRKARVEELLLAGGLSFTILQPTAYMQNLQAQWPRVVAGGELALPYPPGTRLALVDLADVAAVAARVLTEPGHGEAIYELVGMAGPSQDEVAAILGRVANRPVRAVEIPLDRWAAGADQLDDEALETLLAMFRYYGAHGMRGNPNVLRYLLGRAPRDLEEVAREW